MLSTLYRKSPKGQKNFYEVLLENSRNYVFVKDRNFRVIYANKMFLDLYPPEFRDKVIGMVSAKHFTEEEAQVFLAEDRKAFETGFSEIVEEITDYQGNPLILQTQKIRFTDETGEERVLGIATDITKLAAREKLLAKSNLALEHFAALAAHDLRSPLGALSSSLDVIKHDPDSKLGPKTQKHIQLMTICLEGLIDQVAHLLNTYKADDARDTARMHCDLSTLFEEVKFNLSNKIAATHAKVLSTELPRLKVNKAMFRQLIHNLIENSLKYRSEQTPIIVMRYQPHRGHHLFSVEDNGIGVAPENRDAIFGLYSQLDEKADGYGIGLALCRKIIEMHGGQIWLDEKYAPGCKICFTIPMLVKNTS